MTTGPVFRRKVLYVPGFDPFPPRRYRELYRREAAAQAEVSGHRLALGKGCGPTSWRVQGEVEHRQAETEVEVLVWSDIVQHHMAPGIAATYLGLLHTAWIYISTGALPRLMRLRKGPVIAALYPVGCLILQALLAAGAALAVARVAAAWVPTGVTFALAVGIFVLGLRLGRALDKWTFAYYLMQDYAYTARWRGAYGADLQARLIGFAAQIRAAQDSDVDEVLIVGHSSGAHLAISALAEVPVRGDGPALSLLTLGQVVPMVTALPEADALRAHLSMAARRPDLTWVDVTAPGDGCCFALCDPVAVSGVARPDDRGPLVFSARFSETLSPARWQALKRRFFRLHFQYLCAFDQVADYDYFAITAGGRTLADRYAGRPPSASRRTDPVLRRAA